MSSGGAKKSQSLLNFHGTSHADNNDSANGAKHTSKRPRVEEETLGTHLRVPTQDSISDFSSESNVTIITREENSNQDEERIKIIRLDRLRDKEDRYESHIGFLRECLKAKVVPKGLRIDLEPSIGNNDEDFCAKWYARLQEFSLTLMNDILEYSEKIEKTTTDKVSAEKEELKKSMNADDFKEVTEVLNQNSAQRKKQLSLTKKKKFNYLRYNRDPPTDRMRPQNETRSRERQDYRDQRDNNRRSNSSRNNHQNDREPREYPREHTRRSTYRDILITGSRNDSKPSRNNSRTSLYPRNSFINLSRRNSRNNINSRSNRENPTSDKDKEIKELREKLATYERSNPKNERPPHDGGKKKENQKKPDTKEILDFISATMNSLEEYKRLLTV